MNNLRPLFISALVAAGAVLAAGLATVFPVLNP